MSNSFTYDKQTNCFSMSQDLTVTPASSFKGVSLRAFAKELVKDAIEVQIQVDPKQWFKMRIEIVDSKNGQHAWNVTKNMIFDSYQIWQNTSVGPSCWVKMNKSPIDNDTIRQFYNEHVDQLRKQSTRRSYVKYNQNDDQLLSDSD